jgi:DNA-binding MarR family transcriptional regulator
VRESDLFIVAKDPRDAVELAAGLRPLLLRLMRELNREARAFGVTSTQASLLANILDEPGIHPSELAELQGVTTATMSGHLDRLASAGLIERRRGGGDSRGVGIEATAAGRRTFYKIRERRTAWLAVRLAALPAEDFAAVAAAIDPLRKLLED